MSQYWYPEMKRPKVERFDNCQLEIDHNRGVIYVHLPTGECKVRICNINKKDLRREGLTDIKVNR